MSLCISISNQHTHFLTVDTAVSCEIGGETYRVSDRDEQKLFIIDGEGYFFSGDVSLATMVREAFQEQENRDFHTLTNIAKQIFNQYADSGDKLAFSKYGFDKKKHTTIEFTNSIINFEYHFCNGSSLNAWMAYGARQTLAGRIIQDYIGLPFSKVTESTMKEIYEQISDESVGYKIQSFTLSRTQIHMSNRILLNENFNIIKTIDPKRVRFHYGFIGEGDAATPYISMGVGDGGKNNSGKGFINKPNGSLDFIYNASNTGLERSMKLMDSSLLFTSDNGDINGLAKNLNFVAKDGKIKIATTGGSSIELLEDGKIIITGSQIEFITK